MAVVNGDEMKPQEKVLAETLSMLIDFILVSICIAVPPPSFIDVKINTTLWDTQSIATNKEDSSVSTNLDDYLTTISRDHTLYYDAMIEEDDVESKTSEISDITDKVGAREYLIDLQREIFVAAQGKKKLSIEDVDNLMEILEILGDELMAKETNRNDMQLIAFIERLRNQIKQLRMRVESNKI